MIKHKEKYLTCLENNEQQCSTCDTTKPLTEFYFNKTYQKHSARCKSCERRVFMEWKSRNQDRVKIHSKNSYERHKLKRLVSMARDRARRKGFEFSLRHEEIEIPVVCPIFKIPFDNGRFCISIDRIDNSKGYVKDNIQIISRLANTMKNSASGDELIRFCKSILGME